MAKVIQPPHAVIGDGFKIFLAGAIDMGQAVNWQAQVIEKLSNESELILLNPRREDFTPDKLDEQILWELNALERADIIAMWLPADSEAPISLLEAGLYMRSSKLILGIEEGFYRSRNLELTASHYQVAIWRTLKDLIAETMKQYKRMTSRH